MKLMEAHWSLRMRAESYAHTFPMWRASWPQADERWLSAMWVLGNDYRNRTPFYGAYPPNYLRRVMALFPDKRLVLHLFSGSMQKGDYTRFDIRRDLEPDVCGDASSLTKYVGERAFDLILADPPYSAEDAKKYGTPMINRKVVVAECAKALKPRGHLVWLDTTLPMFRKVELTLCGLIGLVRSTNHRFRVASIFERRAEP